MIMRAPLTANGRTRDVLARICPEPATGSNQPLTKLLPREDATPIRDATDPRWVLAVRAADQLEGTVISLDSRLRLMRLGEVLGLTAARASQILDIIESCARQGYAPEACPTAAANELATVPFIRLRRRQVYVTGRRAAALVGTLLFILMGELVLLNWLG